MHHDAWIANRLSDLKPRRICGMRLNAEEANAAFDATWPYCVHLLYMNTPVDKQSLLYKICILYSLRTGMLYSH